MTFDNKIIINKKKKEWCCSLDDNSNIIWGRIYEKKDREILVKHHTSENKQELIAAYTTNVNRSSEQPQTIYEFYTDGSMYNRGQQEVTMGAAWIQTKGPNPESWHATGVENWPSSTRAETTAIATALLTILPNAKVTIHIDSQVCIDTYNRLN